MVEDSSTALNCCQHHIWDPYIVDEITFFHILPICDLTNCLDNWRNDEDKCGGVNGALRRDELSSNSADLCIILWPPTPGHRLLFAVYQFISPSTDSVNGS